MYALRVGTKKSIKHMMTPNRENVVRTDGSQYQMMLQKMIIQDDATKIRVIDDATKIRVLDDATKDESTR